MFVTCYLHLTLDTSAKLKKHISDPKHDLADGIYSSGKN